MNYKLSIREKVINSVIISALMMVLGVIFYGKWWAGIVLMPAGYYFYRERKHQLKNNKRLKLERQFKDMLISISDALNTGYSIENAIRESYKDVSQIYGESSLICGEIRVMLSQIKLNVPIERVLLEFAHRTTLEDAISFSQIFTVAKRRGGSLIEVIKNITDTIVLKVSVKEDIELSINEKKLEQKVMSCIPLFLVVFIGIASPGFLDVMYATWAGRIVMTICLGLYGVAYLWAQKITNVEV